MKNLLLTLTLAGLLTAGASADTYNFNATGARETVTLRGQDEVNITGTANHLELVGSGDELNLMGTANHVTVKSHLKEINVAGSANRITVDADVAEVNLVGSANEVVLIRRPGRALPEITRVGSANKVSEQDAP